MDRSAAELRALFFEAMDRPSTAERAAFLDQACQGRPELRARVETLLRANAEASGFLQEPSPLDGTAAAPVREGPGAVIGPYKLLEQIGEGGFGLVFMAEQQHPVRRKVAIKVIKPGMDSRQVIARFEAERQALALMDHPNIAKVLDGGETGSGRPYFAMELVKGVAITDYCDQHGLSTRERLELFVTVCQAVQHAHHKGIIHRDIKPSNVLVTLHDGTPVVKVIDFGIVKALGQQLTDKTLFTAFAQLVGTPLYMSPEQAEMSGLDVDTRTDVYSLAVLLYELLTGTTPFDKERLRQAGYDEMRRIIREEEPARPSTRISTMGAAATPVSARRQSDPKSLTQQFRGDLDWIVMKALEKDRSRRYESAGSLAADVQRYLHDEPVSACPPSSWYRFRKFARRHRWALALTAVVATALVVIATGSLMAALFLNAALHESEGNRIRAEGAEETAKQAETTATDAARAAREQLYGSLVAQARASRLSRRMGQRFKSLAALAQATKIARDVNTFPDHAVELRNEAIACLALPDLRIAKEWDGWPSDSMLIDFDPALERYARVDRQGVVHIHRVSDGGVIWTLPGFGPGDFGAGQESWLHFSPDGRFLLHKRDGRGVHVWNLGGPEPVLIPKLAAPIQGNYPFAFSPDSRELAVSHADGSIHLVDLPSGQVRKQIEGVANAICLAFHPKARQLAIEHPGGVQVRDLETGEVADLPQDIGNRCIAWHPNGKILAVGGSDLMIHLWDVATRKPILRLEGRRNDGLTFAFNHSGDLVAGGGWDSILHLWDTRTGRELFSTQATVQFPRFSKDDQLAAGIDSENGKLRLWHVALPEGYRTLIGDFGRNLGRVAISTKEPLLAVGVADSVGLYHQSSGTHLAFLAGTGGHLVFEPSGALLTSGEPGLLHWPIQRDRADPGLLRIGPPQKLPLPVVPFSDFATSRDGRVLASTGAAFTLSRGLVWHRDLPGPPLPLPDHFDVRSIDVSPDGRWVATGSHWGRKVIISSARTGKLVHELPVEERSDVRFSPPDGRWLATNGGGNRLWAVDSGREGPYIGGRGNLAFFPDGKVLAVETGLGVIRLVNPDTGREYARLEEPNQNRAAALCFYPDGSRLTFVDESCRFIRVWDLRITGRQLAELGLDWELPAFPPAAERQESAPLRVEVLGDARSPARALAKNNQAWHLATCVELHERDPGRAVALAREAVALAPEEGNYWNTLGVAHYYAGDWDDSIRALDKAMQLQAGQFESFNTFFLAMAHWQRNDKELARKWYAQAVAWTEKNQAGLNKVHAEELRRFRAEAAALLDRGQARGANQGMSRLRRDIFAFFVAIAARRGYAQQL